MMDIITGRAHIASSHHRGNPAHPPEFIVKTTELEIVRVLGRRLDFLINKAAGVGLSVVRQGAPVTRGRGWQGVAEGGRWSRMTSMHDSSMHGSSVHDPSCMTRTPHRGRWHEGDKP